MKTQITTGVPPIVMSILVKTIDDEFPTKVAGAPRKVCTAEVLTYCFLVLRTLFAVQSWTTTNVAYCVPQVCTVE